MGIKAFLFIIYSVSLYMFIWSLFGYYINIFFFLILALFFTSGGGRLGNQILNLIHLIALKQEHNIEVIKINDVFLEARKGFLMYKVSKKIINWKIYY